MRTVLVTGSPEGIPPGLVGQVLKNNHAKRGKATLAYSGAPAGAVTIAIETAKALGWSLAHRDDHAQLLDTYSKAVLVAFWDAESLEAAHCIAGALTRDIPVVVYDPDGTRCTGQDVALAVTYTLNAARTGTTVP